MVFIIIRRLAGQFAVKAMLAEGCSCRSQRRPREQACLRTASQDDDARVHLDVEDRSELGVGDAEREQCAYADVERHTIRGAFNSRDRRLRNPHHPRQPSLCDAHGSTFCVQRPGDTKTKLDEPAIDGGCLPVRVRLPEMRPVQFHAGNVRCRMERNDRELNTAGIGTLIGSPDCRDLQHLGCKP